MKVEIKEKKKKFYNCIFLSILIKNEKYSDKILMKITLNIKEEYF